MRDPRYAHTPIPQEDSFSADADANAGVNDMFS